MSAEPTPEPLPLLVLEGAGCAHLAQITINNDYEPIDLAELPEPDKVTERSLVFWGGPGMLKQASKYVMHVKACAFVDNREEDYADFSVMLRKYVHGDAVIDYIRAHLQVVRRAKPNVVGIGRPRGGEAPVATSGSALSAWQSLPLDKNSADVPHATLANASTIIQGCEPFASLWFDTFRQRIYLGDKPWTDYDDMCAAAWIQQHLLLSKFTLGLVREAVIHASHARERNSVTSWLDSLAWDGTERLDTWLFQTLGVPLEPYSIAVARNWLVSMVARAYKPGCQADHMPILEGSMGRGKTSFLRMLGGPWYSALPDAFGSKDFLQGIQGQWLIEVPDLAGFRSRDHQQLLAIITTTTDRYRASYGRHTEDHPRQCIFAGTSEDDNYLSDQRGRRRFLPLRCGEINLTALDAMRTQLFAEAAAAFKAGHSWHELPQQADREQMDRVEMDPWYEDIAPMLEGRDEVKNEIVLEDWLKLDASHKDIRAEKRVAQIMRRLKFKQAWPKGSDGKTYRAWRRK